MIISILAFLPNTYDIAMHVHSCDCSNSWQYMRLVGDSGSVVRLIGVTIKSR